MDPDRGGGDNDCGRASECTRLGGLEACLVANLDSQTAIRFKKGLAREFREQLTTDAQANDDEVELRKLASPVDAMKVPDKPMRT